MLDQSTLKGRIIAATMRLAAEKPWDDVLMKDIAEAAAIDLAALQARISIEAGDPQCVYAVGR
jgi:hypothetical protein